MSAPNPQNNHRYARLAGALYLTIAVSGGFAIAYVPAQITVPHDPVATFNNISAQSGLFLAGLGGDIVMILAEVALTAMLFFMFRTVHPTLAVIAAMARFAMVAVMAAMLFFSASAFAIATTPELLGSYSQIQRAEFVDFLLYLDVVGVWIWQLFFALHLLLLGWLVAQSDLYPRILGHAMSVGGIGYVLDSLYAFALPDAALLGQIRIGLLAIVTLAEITFALWLIVRGPRAVGESPSAIYA